MIIDVPKYCELHNLRIKKRQGLRQKCNCGETDKEYRECCKSVDEDQKKKVIEEIETYFDQKDKDMFEVVYV